MKSGRCPNCGANLTVDELKYSGVCDFCNTPFITEKAISQLNEPTINMQQTMNNYSNTMFPSKYKPSNKLKPIEPKPKLNIALTILLFSLLIFPGIIYVNNFKKKQKRWKRKHRNLK